MDRLYYSVYGLSRVGGLRDAADVLASVLGMPFQKRNSDWVGDYCIARNEDGTEKIRLLNASGEESYWREDYGDHGLFLEVSTGSLERSLEIEKCLYQARAQFQQADLKNLPENQGHALNYHNRDPSPIVPVEPKIVLLKQSNS